ncbi:Ribosomal protein S3 [Rickettsiales bacterium Ac37b]|nr:Ribosomal protein S3 [Rickettsiales bacterium Ac37b]
MGQKVNPVGFRVAVNKDWDSKWYADKEYANQLHEDLQIRSYLKKALKLAGVSRILIERPAKKACVTIYTAKPGVVIGRKGSDIEKIKIQISKFTKSEVQLNIVEVRKPEIDATLIAESVAQQLERRVAFRRAMKRAIQSCLKMGGKGIRINCSGRLGGAEIARMEWYREGRVPLHTLRADIGYGSANAYTTYGVIGVKVWVYKGDAVDQEVVVDKVQEL